VCTIAVTFVESCSAIDALGKYSKPHGGTCLFTCRQVMEGVRHPSKKKNYESMSQRQSADLLFSKNNEYVVRSSSRTIVFEVNRVFPHLSWLCSPIVTTDGFAQNVETLERRRKTRFGRVSSEDVVALVFVCDVLVSRRVVATSRTTDDRPGARRRFCTRSTFAAAAAVHARPPRVHVRARKRSSPRARDAPLPPVAKAREYIFIYAHAFA